MAFAFVHVERITLCSSTVQTQCLPRLTDEGPLLQLDYIDIFKVRKAVNEEAASLPQETIRKSSQLLNKLGAVPTNAHTYQVPTRYLHQTFSTQRGFGGDERHLWDFCSGSRTYQNCFSSILGYKRRHMPTFCISLLQTRSQKHWSHRKVASSHIECDWHPWNHIDLRELSKKLP